MPNFESMSHEELKAALERARALLQDATDERSFLGKQTSMHIKVAELKRLDQDIEKFHAQVEEIQALLTTKAA